MEESKNVIIKSIFKGVILSFVFILIGITIFAFILANSNLNDNYIKPILIGLTFFSNSIASFISLRKISSKGYIYGAVIGIIYLFIIFILSWFLNFKLEFSVYSYVQIIISILSGMIGGILSVNLK